jgi:translation initiation factor IF-1
MRQDLPTKEGVVVEALPGLTFRVKLNGETGDQLVLAHLAGKMKINNIRVLAGDRVILELSPDGAKGRIVRRLKF